MKNIYIICSFFHLVAYSYATKSAVGYFEKSIPDTKSIINNNVVVTPSTNTSGSVFYANDIAIIGSNGLFASNTATAGTNSETIYNYMDDHAFTANTHVNRDGTTINNTDSGMAKLLELKILYCENWTIRIIIANNTETPVTFSTIKNPHSGKTFVTYVEFEVLHNDNWRPLKTGEVENLGSSILVIESGKKESLYAYCGRLPRFIQLPATIRVIAFPVNTFDRLPIISNSMMLMENGASLIPAGVVEAGWEAGQGQALPLQSTEPKPANSSAVNPSTEKTNNPKTEGKEEGGGPRILQSTTETKQASTNTMSPATDRNQQTQNE